MSHERVRWGLLSTARINERIIPAIRANGRSELIAVASQGGREKAEQYAVTCKIPRSHSSYEALLADREVDAIYIPLPNALHCQWTVAAARAGKHVLCEKPLATSVTEVDEMAAAARKHGIILQEAVMMRYHRQTLELQERLATGLIGEIRAIQGAFSFNLERPHDIRLDQALGGGSIWDLGSYPVNFMRTMLRADPIEVHGWRNGGEGAVDLSFAGHLQFATGAWGQFVCSFQAAPFARVDILGSTGRVALDLPYLNKAGISSTVRILRNSANRAGGTFSDSPAFDEEIVTYESVNAYQNEVDAMVASILDGTPPVVSLADSRGNVATLEALCKSARQGSPVWMEK